MKLHETERAIPDPIPPVMLAQLRAILAATCCGHCGGEIASAIPLPVNPKDPNKGAK